MNSDVINIDFGEVAPHCSGVTSTNPFGLRRLCGTRAEISAALRPVEDRGPVYLGEWRPTCQPRPRLRLSRIDRTPSRLVACRPGALGQMPSLSFHFGCFSLNCWARHRFFFSMPTPPTNARKRSPTPSVVALRRAVASSTALETGQNIQQLEQKLQQPTPQRFAHIKLAA